MDYLDQRAINKTIKSYKTALKKITDVFPSFRLGCGSFNGKDGLPLKMEVLGHNNLDKANHVWIEIQELFNYGTPKIIPKNYNIRKYDFFKIGFYWHENFDIWGWNCAHADENGNITKKKELKVWVNQQISVHLSDKSFGIDNWEENQKKIVDIADKCQQSIKDQILKEVIKATNHISDWKASLQKAFEFA